MSDTATNDQSGPGDVPVKFNRGVVCPECKSARLRVTKKRRGDARNIRILECLDCLHLFRTGEQVIGGVVRRCPQRKPRTRKHVA